MSTIDHHFIRHLLIHVKSNNYKVNNNDNDINKWWLWQSLEQIDIDSRWCPQFRYNANRIDKLKSRLNIDVTGCDSVRDLSLLSDRCAPVSRVCIETSSLGEGFSYVLRQMSMLKHTLSNIAIWLSICDFTKKVELLSILSSLTNLTHLELLYERYYIETPLLLFREVLPLLLQLPLLRHLSIGPIIPEARYYNGVADLITEYLGQQRSLTSLRLTQLITYDQRNIIEMLLQSPKCTIAHLDLSVKGILDVPITKRLSTLKFFGKVRSNDICTSFNNVDHLEWTAHIRNKEVYQEDGLGSIILEYIEKILFEE
ncbi:hypothetical protein SAMD00019534_099710 [Acytostelium subglobosum LB1]|uniref:hypothetical protein n=1 Tax=Acytostelium subglobosum LB1 TaxID=1410327 RepID=UPI0006451F1F|nr:hypothetical protein SAMD00019534_099710 [Acytostelium subglobosum LB1]GAM26796.1 hypothetical protein SAMD00019534_099710 [Acytostelium subglobosum LB1]|eukprot:XP_012750457.1 hypothetical protein SAMD00019534_099710 [Acytostelium subglobosum LB1]